MLNKIMPSGYKERFQPSIDNHLNLQAKVEYLILLEKRITQKSNLFGKGIGQTTIFD